MAGLTFLPVSPAGAEPKPAVQNEVQVGQPAASPAAAPSAAPSAAPEKPESGLEAGGPPAKRVLKRNPFVPPTGGAAAATAPTAPSTPAPAADGGKKPEGGKVKPQVEEEAPEAPGFTLAGIFISGGHPTALLTTQAGVVEARVGDTVEGYKVKTINLVSRQVIVELRKHAFRISLPKDGPYGSGSSGVEGSGGGGSSSGGGGSSSGGGSSESGGSSDSSSSGGGSGSSGSSSSSGGNSGIPGASGGGGSYSGGSGGGPGGGGGGGGKKENRPLPPPPPPPPGGGGGGKNK